MRYRSGSIGLLNLEVETAAQLTSVLERARFQVTSIKASEPANDELDAILIGDHSQTALTTALQTHRASSPHTALIALLQPRAERSCQLLASFRSGADDAVLLPEGIDELLSTIRLSVERRSVVENQERQSTTFVRELGKRTRSLKNAYEQLDEAYEETLLALVRALDTREQATAGHSARVALYALRLALVLGEETESLQSLYQGALLHDIGKIGIPDSILLKPGRLTKAEFKVMETHTTLAARFLEGIPHLRDSLRIPVYHHERYDGSGYPYSIVGSAIPMQARIFAVVDVYDALRSKRPYKGPMKHDDVIDMLQ